MECRTEEQARGCNGPALLGATGRSLVMMIVTSEWLQKWQDGQFKGLAV